MMPGNRWEWDRYVSQRFRALSHSHGPHPVGGGKVEARIIAHVFLMVLIAGTLWRLASYHLIASPQPHLNHLGLAMAQQY